MEPSVTNSTNPDSTEITIADIEQMLQELFESMLGMAIDRAEEGPADAFAGGRCGRIAVSGDWSATLNVFASKDFCNLLSCKMFACDDDALEDSDISDAVGEVANVIGGNIKGIIDLDCNLSIPEVSLFEPEEVLPGPDSLWFDCNGERFCVELQVN